MAKNKEEKGIKNNIELDRDTWWALKRVLPHDIKPTNQEAIKFAVEWFLEHYKG